MEGGIGGQHINVVSGREIELGLVMHVRHPGAARRMHLMSAAEYFTETLGTALARAVLQEGPGSFQNCKVHYLEKIYMMIIPHWG